MFAVGGLGECSGFITRALLDRAQRGRGPVMHPALERGREEEERAAIAITPDRSCVGTIEDHQVLMRAAFSRDLDRSGDVVPVLEAFIFQALVTYGSVAGQEGEAKARLSVDLERVERDQTIPWAWSCLDWMVSRDVRAPVSGMEEVLAVLAWQADAVGLLEVFEDLLARARATRVLVPRGALDRVAFVRLSQRFEQSFEVLRYAALLSSCVRVSLALGIGAVLWS